MSEKGGKFKGIVTEEMLESSESVLQGYRGRGVKGLQQYFTPENVAKFVAKVFGYEVAVVDLTAGDGGLLSGFSMSNRYGVEIDPEQATKGYYKAIVGDIQKVYPLFRELGFKADTIAINPPFGLTWLDEQGEKINSTLLCYRYAIDLLASFGQGVMICGWERYLREVCKMDESKYIYAVVRCDDMFENADIPVAICFFSKHEVEKPVCYESDREGLLELLDPIKDIRDNSLGYISIYTLDSTRTAMDDLWKVVREEYRQRYIRKTKEASHSIALKGGKLAVSLTPYQQVALKNRSILYNIRRLNKQAVSYFALNAKEWVELLRYEEEGALTICPVLKAKVEEILAVMKKQLCPLYPIKPQQRLGFLDNVNEILCTKSYQGEDYSIEAGEKYPVYVSTRVMSRSYTEEKVSMKGEHKEVHKLREWKVLEIKIGGHEFSEKSADIQFIIDHFDLPDPGDLASRFPEAMARMNGILNKLDADTDWSFRDFQRADLARLLMKKGGLLSWKQGLGKTLGGLAFAMAAVKLGAKDRALFVVPQDLLPQWKREAMRFFGRELTEIRSIADAREVRKYLRAGGSGWFITYYEAMSRNGRKFELYPYGERTVPNPKAGERIFDYELRDYIIAPAYVTRDDEEHCPSCGEDAKYGEWYPKRGVCEACGHKHIKLKVKAAYSHLTRVFRSGTVIIDEGTKIKANYSLMSLSLRGIKARYRLLLTGTPIKNYIPDAFWLLWWSLGDGIPQFPFTYEGGYNKFVKDFAVVEYTTDQQGGKRSGMKILPEVSNLSVLWRLLCSSTIRRRKEETGEDIVSKVLKPITCPMGQEQVGMYRRWLAGFTSYFIATHDLPICDYPNLVDRSSAILGQYWKLEFASVLPEAEPTGYYERSSNWTPANLKVLEIAQRHVEQGDKVLIGSSLMAYGYWIATQLQARGIKAEHIIEKAGNGEIRTKSPGKRAEVVHRFRTDDSTSVLCASIYSMKLGHNLDVANVVILRGLPWDYSSFDQFIERVHRLTSTRPVMVYVILADGTIDMRKWELVQQKGAAAELALDGMLFHQEREEISLQQILDEMKERGISTKGSIDEARVRNEWMSKVAESISLEYEWGVIDTGEAIQLDLF